MAEERGFDLAEFGNCLVLFVLEVLQKEEGKHTVHSNTGRLILHLLLSLRYRNRGIKVFRELEFFLYLVQCCNRLHLQYGLNLQGHLFRLRCVSRVLHLILCRGRD